MRKIPEYKLPLVRLLSKQQTDTEALLWKPLRDRNLLGAKFRRQRPLGRYIADFCCGAARLVIEIDGSIHALADQQAYDEIRDNMLNAYGYTILRVTTEEVANDLPNVLARIAHALPQGG